MFRECERERDTPTDDERTDNGVAGAGSDGRFTDRLASYNPTY